MRKISQAVFLQYPKISFTSTHIIDDREVSVREDVVLDETVLVDVSVGVEGSEDSKFEPKIRFTLPKSTRPLPVRSVSSCCVAFLCSLAKTHYLFNMRNLMSERIG